jgi:murein DD-endopeptidase MepM/ murein hydrolase activator NlpD
MMGSGNDRELARTAIALRSTAVLAAIVLLTAGCVRYGPPAPVEDRSHASSIGRSAPGVRPSAEAPGTRGGEPVIAAAPRGAITSAPLEGPPLSPTPSSNAARSQEPAGPSSASSAPLRDPTPPGAAEITVQVAPGQTLYAIARAYNVPIRALIELNELDPPYALRSGQTIRVPNLPTHVVAEGETLSSVSRQYGVGVRALAETNHIGPPYRIVPGSRLLIPRADGATPAVATASLTPTPHVLRLPPGMVDTPSPQPAPPASSPAHVLRLPPGMVDTPPAPSAEPVPASLPVAPAAPSRGTSPGRGFMWPVQGEIASTFGSKPGGTQNDGVNIIARRGTAVHAADDGVVVYAGNELRGYGNLLLIRHANGWMTAYAHNDELLVGRGARVKRGQTIAKVGGTGGVSSPQLHFELRQGGRPVDPMSVMGPMGPS